jgi:hypothetical protein
MRIMKMLLAGIAVLVGTAAASQAAPMSTHLAAMKAAASSGVVQVRWGGGRGGWHGGAGQAGWGHAGWAHGGWGHRGVGYRPWGWGAVAAGAVIGGAIVNSGYYESYPAYGGDHGYDDHYAYEDGYAHEGGYVDEGCHPYHHGYGYGGYAPAHYGW